MALEGGKWALVDFQVTPPLGSSMSFGRRERGTTTSPSNRRGADGGGIHGAMAAALAVVYVSTRAVFGSV